MYHTKEETRQALIGKTIEFHTIHAFMIKRVIFYDTFILVGGEGMLLPIDNEYLPTLTKYGAVEISHRTYTDETKLVNVTIR